jgi:hypothetical protein
MCAFLLAANISFAQCSLSNLNASYCVDDPAFTLTGGTGYWINNDSTSYFDPAALGVGTHRVITTDQIASAYYVKTDGVFSPEPTAGVVTTLTPWLDNTQSAATNIGFDFNFYGFVFTQLRIGSRPAHLNRFCLGRPETKRRRNGSSFSDRYSSLQEICC